VDVLQSRLERDWLEKAGALTASDGIVETSDWGVLVSVYHDGVAQRLPRAPRLRPGRKQVAFGFTTDKFFAVGHGVRYTSDLGAVVVGWHEEERLLQVRIVGNESPKVVVIGLTPSWLSAASGPGEFLSSLRYLRARRWKGWPEADALAMAAVAAELDPLAVEGSVAWRASATKSPKGSPEFDHDNWRFVVEMVTAAARMDTDELVTAVRTLERELPASATAGAYIAFMIRARIALMHHGGPTEDDLHEIAERHMADFRRVLAKAGPTLFEDTLRLCYLRPPLGEAVNGGMFIVSGSTALGLLCTDVASDLAAMRPSVEEWWAE
jgi:hypothetical protein